MVSPRKLESLGMTQDGLPGASFAFNGTAIELWENISSSSSNFITDVILVLIISI